VCQKETIKNFKGMAGKSQEAAIQSFPYWLIANVRFAYTDAGQFAFNPVIFRLVYHFYLYSRV
jgi:hypothetical protein